MEKLTGRETAVLWVLSIPMWAVTALLLFGFRFEVFDAARNPFFWLFVAAYIWWWRRVARDARRWSTNRTPRA